MKKTALTFGLFSLVMVATSFAAPKTVSPLLAQNQTIERDRDSDGGATGGQKKRDFHLGGEQSLSINKQLNFASVNQSIGTDKKVD